MNFLTLEIILLSIFIIFVSTFLFFKRKNITLQKIIYPFLYLILYRSNFGIKFMEKFSKKYKEIIIFFGYCCIGLSVIGMIFISLNIILMLYSILKTPSISPGVALVLPFTNIPGLGWLGFLHWIIAIFILAIVHEFAHGIVAKAHGLKIKSAGFAFFALLAPIIPAAFVEPDEEKLKKQPDVVKYSIYAAGPMVNIFLAIILLIALPYVGYGLVHRGTSLAPFENTITDPIGFSFDLTNSTLPAANAGLENEMIVTHFNGEQIYDANSFLETMYLTIKPGDNISLTVENKTYIMTTVKSTDNRGIIGVTNFKNERRVKSKYKLIKPYFYWLKDLFKWVFVFNLFVGLFNLLPLGIVDGGRILKTLLDRIMKDKKKAQKVWGLISFFFLAVLILGLVTTYFGNPLTLLK